MDGNTVAPAPYDLTPEALADAFAIKLKRDLAKHGLTQAEAAFLTQVHEDCAIDEFPGVSASDLAHMLSGFWDFAEKREGAEPMIRLTRAYDADGRDLKRDLLEIVQDDAPFLVDSVMGEIAEQGFQVRAMFHPVVEVARDAQGMRQDQGEIRRESMIQVLLEAVGEDRRDALLDGVRATLADVRVAVADYDSMADLLWSTASELEKGAPGAAPGDLEEDVAFLRWLRADHFVLLGSRCYTYPRTPDGGYAPEEPQDHPELSRGVLRDHDRPVLRRSSEPAILSAELRLHLEHGAPLVVAKSNLRSRVHRRAYMDYIGVKHYGPDGLAAGETRFVGLFTAEAYDQAARDVPLIRRKVAHVMERAGKTPDSHNEKRLRNIVENYPRDELFQMSEDELLAFSLGILHLYDLPRVKLFARKDPFGRFISVLLYLPRDRYDSGVRERAGRILAYAWHGRVSANYPSYSDAPLARIHYIIGVTPGQDVHPDIAALEARIGEACRTWEDRFDAAARDGGVAAGSVADVLKRYAGAFPPGYRDIYDATEALADMEVLESLRPEEPLRVRAFRNDDDSKLRFRFKLYRPEESAPLAEVLPILDNMGLKALVEEGFPIRFVRPDGQPTKVWVHEFEMEDEHGEKLQFNDIKDAFESAFTAVWTGRTESDGFNRLVLELGVPWREAALIRALCRYRQQSGLDPSQLVQETALRENPEVARLILDLFRTKFDPAIAADVKAREQQADAVVEEITAALQEVASLDADRVLRRLAKLTQALKRTNYYQTGEDGEPKPYISFKIASRELEDLPAPKPFREIFVWATHVEGVHLRFGPIARGGLRWSDRRDDFRTEVLGLVKAQQVKNAVIVPVGSKGGFFPKCLPRGGAPDAIRAEGVRAYKTFLCGLLDITDNLDPQGEVVRPEAVIAYEDDDPYLVVAADKGTATFSDIANGVAEDYGFWLGDAFASGGSAGYDHKVMGITAKGAWEAVKRHFRELGKDIQAEPFTVVGVGDMSGDVFGNGMLLSKQIKLLAAFDHRHIFLDPDPDPAKSWDERKRMFDLPRSSWADYDASLISKGGGIFPRTLKSIALTPEVQAMLDLKTDALPPTDLINAILKARAELLYLGGIGTYVKAPSESNLQVGDKANDAVRVNGTELRVKVVGEGANLGVTQAGRIAYARTGRGIDTDAIDNSAGVDTSDHEVNIKILTGALERSGKLTREARDKLLASMTDEVAEHVLAHNYDQTLALSLMEMDVAAELEQQAKFMSELEARGKLDRKVEGLPGQLSINELAQAGKGLTRPELAVLLAYGKLDLFEDIIASRAPDDPVFLATLEAYFPKPLSKYEDEMKRHRLRREIIATVIDNEMVNLCGPTFPSRLRAAADCDTTALVIGFEAARRVLRLDETWGAVAALDGKIKAAGQMALFHELSNILRGQTFWLARRAAKADATLQGVIDAYRPPMDELKAMSPEVLSTFEQRAVARRAKAFVQHGAPEDLAQQIAALRPLTTAADLADLANVSNWPVGPVARLYHQVGAAFGFDRLRAAAGTLAAGDQFERLAVRRLIEDMLSEQTAITRAVMSFSANADAAEDSDKAKSAVSSWSALRPDPARAAKRTIEEIEAAGGGWSFAKLTIANAALRELATAAK